jgi:membrane associated rhomboid family serine protease
MMSQLAPTPDAVLRLCAAADQTPWFPSQYAQAAGIDRNSLDDPLNQLRIAGLVRIGGWEAGKGQWYVLTDSGREAVANPGAVARTRDEAVRPVAPLPRNNRLTAWERAEAVRSAFFADRSVRSPVLFTLVAAQVIVFIFGLAIVLRDKAPINQYLGSGLMPGQIEHRPALVSPMQPLVLTVADLAQDQWWRLLTYGLVHYGLLHLGMNLYGHFALGRLVERMYGSVRFLVLYLLSDLGGGVAVALLDTRGASTAGSSGALCGLIGGFAGFVLLNRRHLGGDLYDRCRQWLGNTLVLLILFSMLPSVSWQGHLGGFLAGFVAGVLLTYHRFGSAEQRWAALLGLVLLPIAGIAPLVEKGLLHHPRPPVPEEHGAAEVPPEVQQIFFNTVVGKPTEQVRLEAYTASEKFIDPIRDQRPDTRDPKLVRTGREVLAALRRDQERVRAQVARVIPFGVPAIEDARQAALAYLTAALSLTSTLDECLERGPKWNESRYLTGEPGAPDEMRLQQVANDAMEADLRWRHLARIVISMKAGVPDNRRNQPTPNAKYP